MALWVALAVSVVGGSLILLINLYATGVMNGTGGNGFAALRVLISPFSPMSGGLILAILLVAGTWPRGRAKRWFCCSLGLSLAAVVAWQLFTASGWIVWRIPTVREVAFEVAEVTVGAFGFCALGLLIVFAVSCRASLRSENVIPESEGCEPVAPPKRALFASLQGRVGRKTYWIVWAILAGFTLACCLASYVVGKVAADSLNAGIVIDVVWLVIFLFVALIVHVRRWHDLGFSGWMSLTANMPYLGLIISVAILGFVRGADGPNIYGEDPVFRRCRPGPQPLVN